MPSNNELEIQPEEAIEESRLDRDDAGAEVEDTSSEAQITEPFDPTLIRVEARPYTLDLFIERMKNEEINMMPDFQRRAGIWKDEAQSKLIESILIRIPLPAFYMDGTDENSWLVVDGLQRLTTLKRFVIDKTLSLSGLEFLTQFQGKKYDDLPRLFQRRIKESQVTVYIIEKGTPPEVKFNVFKRINTGGLPLSSQEIRHALNQGNATQLLEKLANSKQFKEATVNGISGNRMADRECVLRFFAFCLKPYEEYKSKDFDAFLGDVMTMINDMSDKEIQNLESRFYRSMKAAREIFGNEAFRKKYSVDQRYRNPINKALFESWSVNLDALDDDDIELLTKRNKELLERFAKLMRDVDFDSAISQGTGNISKVKKRFGDVKEAIREVLQ